MAFFDRVKEGFSTEQRQIGRVSFLSFFGCANSRAKRKKCYQQLTNGIFYPRSKKRTIVFTEGNDETFISTLSDPAGQLVYQGEFKRDPEAQTMLLLCTIRQGAVFYSIAKTDKNVIHQLDIDTELEALCQEDEWTSAVLPGIGFGWVKNDQFICTEHETIYSAHRNDVSVDWVFNMPLSTQKTLQHCIGLKHLGLATSVLSDDEWMDRLITTLEGELHSC